MGGNAWEWAADWYDKEYYARGPARNPKGPASGSLRVGRGGVCSSDVFDMGGANRNSNRPMAKSDRIGFRCAKD
jgi:iron(II)-dependent oxidoreductase